MFALLHSRTLAEAAAGTHAADSASSNEHGYRSDEVSASTHADGCGVRGMYICTRVRSTGAHARGSGSQITTIARFQSLKCRIRPGGRLIVSQV